MKNSPNKQGRFDLKKKLQVLATAAAISSGASAALGKELPPCPTDVSKVMDTVDIIDSEAGASDKSHFGGYYRKIPSSTHGHYYK